MTLPRGIRGYAFTLIADDETVSKHFDLLFEAFDTSDPDSDELHEVEILTRSDEGERVLVDRELAAQEQVRGRIVSTVVHTLARQMIEACDALGIHAGGVVRHGVGVALPAQMESGKSTLTTGLIRAGFDYLTDEAVLLDWETLTAIPFPKPISLDPGSWYLFPELEPQAALPQGYKDAQWQIPPSAIRADAVGGPCRIRYFVFPEYANGAETRLTPLRRAEATIELAKNTFRFNERPRRSLDALALAVRDADCYKLAIGDLETAVALLTQLVEQGS